MSSSPKRQSLANKDTQKSKKNDEVVLAAAGDGIESKSLSTLMNEYSEPHSLSTLANSYTLSEQMIADLEPECAKAPKAWEDVMSNLLNELEDDEDTSATDASETNQVVESSVGKEAAIAFDVDVEEEEEEVVFDPMDDPYYEGNAEMVELMLNDDQQEEEL